MMMMMIIVLLLLLLQWLMRFLNGNESEVINNMDEVIKVV